MLKAESYAELKKILLKCKERISLEITVQKKSEKYKLINVQRCRLYRERTSSENAASPDRYVFVSDNHETMKK